EATANPDALGFDCADAERGQTHNQLWSVALRPLLARLETQGQAAWGDIVAEYDRYSTREFLESCGWSEAAIEMFGLLADHEVLLTVPFPVLRHMESQPLFSRAKQRAIRQLHYDASAKIWLQFRRRFWEEDEGIFGGGTATDLPIRVVYYPDHGRETGRGVVL